MAIPPGYLHLNTANRWPSFELHEVDIAPNGSLTLARSGEDFVARGVLRGGPFQVHGDSTAWYRLRVDADPLAGDAHLQLFTFTAASDDPPPFDPASDEPFGDRGWRAAPRDGLDMLIPNAPASRLWIGAVLRSQGAASPVLHQMRVDYGRDTYLAFLPAIYGEGEPGRDFLERFLSLPASVLGRVEGAIADLPRLFDPWATPAGEFPSWLGWLSGWLAFDPNESWSDAKTREYLAQAFELYGWRGTIEGLRRYLKIYAGVEARIDEPGRYTSLWSLGHTSTLGFTTMLAPAHLQGAVIGTSATLDQSHLATEDDFGAAMFEDTAHRFCVSIYCAELTRPGALADARAVIEREKPAHTVYHLCVIEPRMRVGAQARVGIDAIVGQGPPAAQVGMALDTGTLAAKAEPCDVDKEV